MDLREVIEKLESSEGYMIGVSFLNDKKLEHVLLTENFQLLDMIHSNEEIRKLVIEQLGDTKPQHPTVIQN